MLTLAVTYFLVHLSTNGAVLGLAQVDDIYAACEAVKAGHAIVFERAESPSTFCTVGGLPCRTITVEFRPLKCIWKREEKVVTENTVPAHWVAQ